MTTRGTARASAVAMGGAGLLILGASGAGKSQLALELIALGARLIADDLVALARIGDALYAAAPAGAPALVEARGVGLLSAPRAPGPVRVRLAIDLDLAEAARLPPLARRAFLGAPTPLIGRPPHLSAAAVAAALAAGGPRDPETPV